MALTATLTLSVSALAQQEAFTLTRTAEGADLVPVAIPAGTVAERVETSFTYADLQMALLGARNATLTVRTNAAVLAPPAAPTVNGGNGSSTILAGTYKAKVSYVNAYGESLASAFTSVVVETDNSTVITVTHPDGAGVDPADVTSYYVYLTGPGGSVYHRQQAAGSPTAIGNDFVLNTPPTSTGAIPPTSSLCFAGPGDTLVLPADTAYPYTSGGSIPNPFSRDVVDIAVTNGPTMAAAAGTRAGTLVWLILNTRTS